MFEKLGSKRAGSTIVSDGPYPYIRFMKDDQVWVWLKKGYVIKHFNSPRTGKYLGYTLHIG